MWEPSHVSPLNIVNGSPKGSSNNLNSPEQAYDIYVP